MNYEALIAEAEANIRQGQAGKSAKLLAKIDSSKAPRKLRLPLANLCRRTGLYAMGLTLLYKVINPSRPLSDATPQELAEYSVLLLRSGALDEARETLERVDTSIAPEGLLYRAFCDFTSWDGENSVPHLQKYLTMPLAPYPRLVGQANLAHAFVDGSNPKLALPILDEVITSCEANGHHGLRNTCLAMRAQVNIDIGDYKEARSDLARAHAGGGQSYDQQRVGKWDLILEALERKRVEPLAIVKKNAIQVQDWETLREADLYSLSIEFREEIFQHLLFGTPFAGFRARVQRLLGKTTQRDIYVLGRKSCPRFDLARGVIGNEEVIRPGGKAHQLLVALTDDFYRPLAMGNLFSDLFPGEHFNIFSSPNRVHKIISRSREWIDDSGLPLEIAERDGFYSLRVTGDLSLRVTLNRQPLDLMHTRFAKLQDVMGSGKIFSAQQASERLDISRTALKQLFAWGIEQGRLERLGANQRSAKYRILSAAPASLRAAG